MKYKTGKLNNGNYATFAGKRYFPATESETFESAEKLTLEYSAQWYREQLDICREKWLELQQRQGIDVDFDDWCI